MATTKEVVAAALSGEFSLINNDDLMQVFKVAHRFGNRAIFEALWVEAENRELIPAI
jgi:hypothetical protein